MQFCILVHKNSQVISIKSGLIFNVSNYRHTTQTFVHAKINTYYSNEMSAYKYFHIFASVSVIQTCVIALVLKDKNGQH